jgi:3-hydroxyisobutyrate dehydrogenase-like beta-hydroxyacid dehydrogenase
MTRIAVLGMGRMGQAAAMRLLDLHHEVFVWNRTLGKLTDVVSAGAHAPADLRATVEAAEIVVTVLADDDAVSEVVLADDGLAGMLGDRLYIDSSTISPALSARLAERVDRFIAMPIAGAPSALREGTASCLAGGASDLIDEAKPLTEAFASVHAYPSAEQAAVAKITHNALLLVGLAGLCECIALGRAGGLSDSQLSGLLESSPMLGPGIRNRLAAVIAGDGPTWWTVDLGVKDSALALDLASADLPVTRAAFQRYAAAAAQGLGAADIALITRLYQR